MNAESTEFETLREITSKLLITLLWLESRWRWRSVWCAASGCCRHCSSWDLRRQRRNGLATEELTASIGEIGQQVKRSAEITGKAAEEADRTNAVVAGLLSGTEKIGQVAELIQKIAS
jgi:hypothetical protein